MNYYWIRVFNFRNEDKLKLKEKNKESRIQTYKEINPDHTDEELEMALKYDYSIDYESDDYKGELLYEDYECGESLTRDEVKKKISENFGIKRFAKARKDADCIYAIVMSSSEYFYSRFKDEIDTICHNPKCNRHLKGKMKNFRKYNYDIYNSDDIKKEPMYFCSYDCERTVRDALNPRLEGDWQSKSDYHTNGGVYGYIYHIFNKVTGMHYIGQTRFMPFFRWQEHVKAGEKGEICDLVFETITEVRVLDQDYLNSMEAWWINTFIEDYGKENVINVMVPKVSITDIVTQAAIKYNNSNFNETIEKAIDYK